MLSEKTRKRKKGAYNSAIMNVEHGTFTPLFFSLTGGEGPETLIFFKHIAQKKEEKYEKVQTLIRCKLSFLILRLVLLCIKGRFSDLFCVLQQVCFNWGIGINLFGPSHFESQVTVLILILLIIC